jgi:hypothetical protein
VKTQGSTIVIDESEDEGTGAQLATGAAIVIEDEGEDKRTKLPARAVRNDDGTITLPLLAPVTLTVKNARGTKEERYDEIVFHEMTGLDLRLVAQAPAEKQTIVAMARAARISTQRMDALFDQLKAKDVTAATAVISFLNE